MNNYAFLYNVKKVVFLGFGRLNLRRSLLGTVGQDKFRRTAPVRRTAVPLILTNVSIVNRTRAKANGATTFKLPVLRRISIGRRRVRTVIMSPAHRLTVRARRRLCHLNGSGHTGIRIICNKTSVQHRVGLLGRIPRVLIKAPKELLSRVGHGAISLSRIGALILSRTSRVLSVNFLRSVRTVVGGIPRRERALLFSTAVPGTVHSVNRGFVRRPRIIGVGTGRLAASLISRCFIGTHRCRGFSVVAHVLSMRTPRLAVIFNQAGHHISRLSGKLRTEKCGTTNVRNSLARRHHVGVLGGFGRKHLSVLITASITTEKLSVSNIARICGCSVPRSPRDCIRHVKHANHTKRRNVSMAFIAPGRVRCLHIVRHLAGGHVRPLHPPARGRTFVKRVSDTLKSVGSLIRGARARGCRGRTGRLLRRCSTIRLITTLLGRVAGSSTDSIPIGVAPRHPLPEEGDSGGGFCNSQGEGNGKSGHGKCCGSQGGNQSGGCSQDGHRRANGHGFAVEGGGSWTNQGHEFSGDSHFF